MQIHIYFQNFEIDKEAWWDYEMIFSANFNAIESGSIIGYDALGVKQATDNFGNTSENISDGWIHKKLGWYNL